jgi:hypothetical protein
LCLVPEELCMSNIDNPMPIYNHNLKDPSLIGAKDGQTAVCDT